MDFKWILVTKKSRKFVGWSEANDVPSCGEPDILEWIEWNKELPDDIDDGGYLYKNKKLVKK